MQEEKVPEAEGDAPGDEETNEKGEEEEPEAEAVNVEDDEPGTWEETFKTYPDSKPYGEQVPLCDRLSSLLSCLDVMAYKLVWGPRHSLEFRVQIGCVHINSSHSI